MRDLFYGWYMKCQSDSQTLAIILAVHRIEGKRICSAFRMRNGNTVIGENRFGRKGIRLSINISKLYIRGKVNFGSLSPLKYDIMGPFTLIPCMECRHSVWSMRHPVQGMVDITGQKYVFKNAWGYWKCDL